MPAYATHQVLFRVGLALLQRWHDTFRQSGGSRAPSMRSISASATDADQLLAEAYAFDFSLRWLRLGDRRVSPAAMRTGVPMGVGEAALGNTASVAIITAGPAGGISANPLAPQLQLPLMPELSESSSIVSLPNWGLLWSSLPAYYRTMQRSR